MPVYEDETLHGALKKAIRGNPKLQKQGFQNRKGSACAEVAGLSRRAIEDLLAASRRLDGLVPRIRAVHSRLRQNEDELPLFEAYDGLLNFALGLSRNVDLALRALKVVPQRYDASEPQGWVGQALRGLENIALPSRRLEFLQEQTRSLDQNFTQLVGEIARTQDEIAARKAEIMALLKREQECIRQQS